MNNKELRFVSWIIWDEIRKQAADDRIHVRPSLDPLGNLIIDADVEHGGERYGIAVEFPKDYLRMGERKTIKWVERAVRELKKACEIVTQVNKRTL